jgi:hypothetical protein
MSTGSFDFNPSDDVAVSEPATPILVCRYDSTQESGSRYTYLPNVWCDQIQVKDSGPHGAQFRYVQYDFVADGSPSDTEDQDENPDYPSQFEEIWPINSAVNDYKVVSGDELVVLSVDPEGNYRVLWHGHATVPQVDLDPGAQVVSFTGASVAARLWDTVIEGRLQRNGDTPTTPGDPGNPDTMPFGTDLETRFNSDDHPNCIPDSSDETLTDQAGNTFNYPVFFEPKYFTNPGGDPDTIYAPVATFWTLSKLVRYLLAVYNGKEDWVSNPDFSVLDNLLSARMPTNGQGFYDPADSSTYTQQPVIIRDYDATNKPFIDAIDEQLHYAGFRMRFVCEGQPSEGGDGDVIIEEPYNYIEIYRYDAAGPADPLQCWLPVTRTQLDPDYCNVASFTAVNDFHSLANQFAIETRPNRYEVSVVLCPLFQPQSGDAVNPQMQTFLKANVEQPTATLGQRQAYRWYGVDELGEGHWPQGAEDYDYTAFDFSPIFPPETFDFETMDGLANDEDQGPGIADQDQQEPGGPTFSSKPTYCIRYRHGLRHLFSKDAAGKVLNAQLAVSRDYANKQPAVWDGTGTWQIVDGGWELLPDQLGINVTIEDVNAWAIGKLSGATQEPSGTLQGILSIAAPTAAQRQKYFYLRLTCVIESDQCIEALAKKRETTPYPFTIERRVDAKDHFVKNVIDGSSAYFDSQGGTQGTPLIAKDDTLAAQTHVEQMRAAHEFPPLAATIVAPWFTRIYKVSDRIQIMAGRQVSFQVNAGSEQSEAPSYPFVAGLTWDFRGAAQKTILMLSDRRMEPRK